MVPILFRAQILHKKLAVWHMSFWTHQPSFTGVNSLAPGNFKSVIFKLMSMIDILRTSCEIALMRMPQIHIGDKSVLVQVMVWCRQATSHYLSQCWPRSLSPYGTTMSYATFTLCPSQCPFSCQYRSLCLNNNAVFRQDQFPYQSPIQCHQIPILLVSIILPTMRNWNGHLILSESCILSKF